MLCRSLFTWEAQPRISDATPEPTPELEAIDDATAETVC